VANLNRAKKLIEQDRLADAREIIVEVLHNDYDNLDAWLLLTACARDREEYARALREILRINPENKEARQLAVELAQETAAGTERRQEDEFEPQVKHVRRRRRRVSPAVRLARFFLNVLAFLVVVAIAGGVAYLFIDSQSDEPAQSDSVLVATPDAAQQCTDSVENVYSRFAARCSVLAVGEACLANSAAFVESNTGQTDLLSLPGDRTLLSNLQSLETRDYNPDEYTWGLVVLKGQTSFDAGSGDGLLMAVTSGVRMRFFDDKLNQITFSSNPVVGTCQAVPPAGLLVHVEPTQSAAFEVNGEPFILSGTAFMQVDVAAGLRVLVLRGELSIVETSRIISSGQWARFSVDPTLLTDANVPVEVFESSPNIRGDVTNVFALGQVLGLSSEQWVVPGINISPVVTVTPQPVIAPPTAAQQATATPVPPDMTTPDDAEP
jgi:hypothetical protein